MLWSLTRDAAAQERPGAASLAPPWQGRSAGSAARIVPSARDILGASPQGGRADTAHSPPNQTGFNGPSAARIGQQADGTPPITANFWVLAHGVGRDDGAQAGLEPVNYLIVFFDFFISDFSLAPPNIPPISIVSPEGHSGLSPPPRVRFFFANASFRTAAFVSVHGSKKAHAEHPETDCADFAEVLYGLYHYEAIEVNLYSPIEGSQATRESLFL